MRILLIILWGLVPCFALAQGSAIAGAEYFVNTDPGLGLATPVNATDGRFDGVLEQIEFDLDTAALTYGAHTVYLRFQDQNGIWGRPQAAAVQVVLPPDQLRTDVVAAEYYIDLDPGQGQATAINGTFSSATATGEFTLPTTGLPPGTHVAYIRFQDQNGTWGRPKSAAFEVSIALQDLQVNLTGAEYFIDQDPGQGQATAINGSFSGQTSTLSYDIDTAGLAPGSHVAYTRFQDQDGIWGRPQSAAFQVSIPAEDLITNIAAAEYFIDTDPGEGQAIAVGGDFNSDTVAANFEIDTAGLTPGSHVAYTRFQDQDGIWGRVQSAPFQVSAPPEDLITNIIGAEYFIDTDPGEGQAIFIEGQYNSDTIESSVAIETADIPPGAHVAYIRYQDQNGRWGRVKSIPFQISTPPEDLITTLTAAEYFIDKDPGEGQAIPLAAEDGSFDSATDIASLDINTEGLAQGRHVAYVRFQDQNGVWGRPIGDFFNVRTTPVGGENAEFTIAAAEYFIDTDPGQGNATALEPLNGAFGTAVIDVAAAIETFDLSVGTHSVSVRFQDQNGTWGQSRSTPFTVEPPPPEQPEMALDDSGPHDFGTLRVDTQAEWSFVISNAASAPDTLKVRALEVDAPYFVSIASFNLAPGGRQRVTVTFFPSAEGQFNQALTIRSNDTRTPSLRVELNGIGVPEQPLLTLSTPTNSHDFGAVPIGRTGEWQLSVGNDGVDTLRVLEIATAAPFSATPGSFNVPPGQQQQVTVVYTPTAVGVVNGTLSIRNNDTTQRQIDVALQGEGVEFGVPVAIAQTPDGEQTGTVTIPFQVSDDDNNDITLAFAYEVDGTRQAATVGGVNTQLSSADYADQTLTLQWDSATDLPGQDVIARFVISVSDAANPDGKQAFTGDFRVDNNAPPVAILAAPSAPTNRQIELAYTLTDDETDILGLTAEYSTDNGVNWHIATILGATENIIAYAGTSTWDAFADLDHGRFSAGFRLTPTDNDLGTQASVDLQLVHLAADYNGDETIDLDDLTTFLVAWNQPARDTSADIGPATGQVPDLLPVLDGALDFEDLVVFIQMWNWSAEVTPAAKLAAQSTGPQVITAQSTQQGDQVRVDLRLDAGQVLAAGLELNFDPNAWDLIQVTPGDAFAHPQNALVLQHVHQPGRITLQLGSLSGPATAGTLAQLHFSARQSGRPDLDLSYDLRDPTGRRYAAGFLQPNIKPVPEQFFLGANTPNPFNPSTQISYGLTQPAQVELTLYDILGQPIRRLVAPTFQAAGYYRVEWDARDESGRSAGSGLYLYRLIARPSNGATQVQTRRMLLLR